MRDINTVFCGVPTLMIIFFSMWTEISICIPTISEDCNGLLVLYVIVSIYPTLPQICSC